MAGPISAAYRMGSAAPKKYPNGDELAVGDTVPDLTGSRIET